MAPFYLDTVQVVRPATIPAEHGRGSTLSYDLEHGAQIVTVTQPVEIQPAQQTERDDHTRTATSSTFVLITQNGQDIDLKPDDRVICRYGELDVDGEVARWPDTRWESGIHHAEATLIKRTG